MTLEELREEYKVLYAFIKQERLMRSKVFPEGHPDRVKKLAAADRAMVAATKIKDAFKALLSEGQPQQQALLEVSVTPKYN